MENMVGMIEFQFGILEWYLTLIFKVAIFTVGIGILVFGIYLLVDWYFWRREKKQATTV